MSRRQCLFVLVLTLSLLAARVAAPGAEDDVRHKAAAADSKSPEPRELVRVQTVTATAEIAGEFGPPFRCDQDGNLYLHGETFGFSSLRKLSPKGERLATYDLHPDPSVKSDFSPTFALHPDGDVYVLAPALDQPTQYVYFYRGDGRYKSTIKLNPGFVWSTAALAVYSSGELLLTGHRSARGPDRQIVEVPFTGLFRSNGTLLKEIALEEDSALQDLADAGDKTLKSPRTGQNRAISFSQATAGQDGNVYLMRWFSPAILFAISAGGEVVRRFAVDPGDATYFPMGMHISGNRMAVQFYQPETGKRLMKIVDLEGNPLATYSHSTKDPERSVGIAFVCYTGAPERFTFLGATDESKLQLIIAEGR